MNYFEEVIRLKLGKKLGSGTKAKESVLDLKDSFELKGRQKLVTSL
jgi:hypothetical protein